MVDSTDKLNSVAQAIKDVVGPNWGFVVMIFPRKEDAVVSYASDSIREDVVGVLEGTLNSIKSSVEEQSSCGGKTQWGH